MASVFAGFLDLLAPPTCAGCDLPTPTRWPAFCDACAPLIERAPASLMPPAPAAAVYLYQGPLADAIRRFKYQGRSDLAVSLGALFVTAAAPYAGQVDVVVPVPLHPTKLRARGWNPASLLAGRLARTLGAPIDYRALRRTRPTATQAGLPRAERAANVRGAFAVAAKGWSAGQRILLVDDVRTTGATLGEAARALAEHGHDVATLAFAWALN